jgi:hypothetical protein
MPVDMPLDTAPGIAGAPADVLVVPGAALGPVLALLLRPAEEVATDAFGEAVAPLAAAPPDGGDCVGAAAPPGTPVPAAVLDSVLAISSWPHATPKAMTVKIHAALRMTR